MEMKRKDAFFRILSILMLLLLAPIATFAGPFGLEMGMSLEQIRSVTSMEPKLSGNNIYFVTPIKTHPMFETYVVRVSPTTGIYWIKAITSTINTSVYGDDLKLKFGDLISSLEKTYGKSTQYDFLKSGSIWNEGRDWMMGLLKKERYLAAFWERDNGANLPDGMMSINILATALSTETAFISLEYAFSNMDAGEEEQKKVEESVF